MSVVPMRTVMVFDDDGTKLRSPVTRNMTCVGTVSVCAEVQSPPAEPTGRVEVTANGSPGNATHGLVALSAAARPPGPFVEVKMSGWTGFRSSDVRMSAPLLKMTTGAAVAVELSPGGTTKLIWFGATK